MGKIKSLGTILWAIGGVLYIACMLSEIRNSDKQTKILNKELEKIEHNA